VRALPCVFGFQVRGSRRSVRIFLISLIDTWSVVGGGCRGALGVFEIWFFDLISAWSRRKSLSIEANPVSSGSKRMGVLINRVFIQSVSAWPQRSMTEFCSLEPLAQIGKEG